MQDRNIPRAIINPHEPSLRARALPPAFRYATPLHDRTTSFLGLQDHRASSILRTPFLAATAIVGALTLIPLATSAMAAVDTDTYREFDQFLDVFNRVKAGSMSTRSMTRR